MPTHSRMYAELQEKIERRVFMRGSLIAGIVALIIIGIVIIF